MFKVLRHIPAFSLVLNYGPQDDDVDTASLMERKLPACAIHLPVQQGMVPPFLLPALCLRLYNGEKQIKTNIAFA